MAPARTIIVSAKPSRPSDPPPPQGGYGAASPPPQSGYGEASLSRRELLASALMLPVLASLGQRAASRLPTLPDIRKAPYRVVGGPGADALVVTREWSEPDMVCKSRLTNPTDRPVAVTEVVAFEINLRLVPETSLLYGEGFQMLSQTAGTVGAPVDVGCVHGCEALQNAGSGRQADVLWTDDPGESGARHRPCVGACLHFLPALQRPVPLPRRLAPGDRR